MAVGWLLEGKTFEFSSEVLLTRLMNFRETPLMLPLKILAKNKATKNPVFLPPMENIF